MDKTIKLATKPKRAAPKAKYIDPIVQGTFAQDGSLQEIIKSLTVRLRDENTTVIFKSLLVLHTLLRSGSLEPTYSYLSGSSISLSLSSSDTPNLAAYASYLAARIKSYSNLKRDIIRDKSDRKATNRLRGLEVDKGLLREVREVQRMVASLVEAKFYLDDIDDDVSMTALRLLVKDLLVLFQALNEGVINVLEHYFEMSHPDATTALKIYKTFCRDTEKVVAYLSVAKKLQNVLNVPIPNLKHAPVSLAGSLEEYLNDPNFQANREEYKENKRIADGGAPKRAAVKASNNTASPSTPPVIAPGASVSTPAPNPTAFTDFFESIETAQTSMFNPSTNSPSSQYFQQQSVYNPFLLQQQQQQQMPMMTGGGNFGMMYQASPLAPQATGMGYAAFGGAPPNPFQQQQQRQQYPFLQSQQTGFPPMQLPQQQQQQPVQPQMTGANPFRQSMMFSQATGAGGMGNQFFNGNANQNQAFSQFQQTGSPSGQPQQQPYQPQIPLHRAVSPNSVPSPTRSNTAPSMFNPPTPTASAILPQATGSKNPFGQRVTQPPPVPALPSMAELAFGPSSGSGVTSYINHPFGAPTASPGAAPVQKPQSTGMMGSIASDFTFQRQSSPSPLSQSTSPYASNATTAAPTTNSTFAPSSAFSAFNTPSSQPSTPFSVPSHSPAPPSTTPFYQPPPPSVSAMYDPRSQPPLRSQTTGFAPMKAFVPTSSFGANLNESLGPSPITQHATGGRGGGGVAPNPFRMGSPGGPSNNNNHYTGYTGNGNTSGSLI